MLFKKGVISLLSVISLTVGAHASRLCLEAEFNELQIQSIKQRFAALEQENLTFLDRMFWKTTLVHYINEEQAQQLVPYCQDAMRELKLRGICGRAEKADMGQWRDEADKTIHNILVKSDNVSDIITQIRNKQSVKNIVAKDFYDKDRACENTNFFGGILGAPKYGIVALMQSSEPESLNQKHDSFAKIQEKALQPDAFVFNFTTINFQYFDNNLNLVWSQPWDLRSDEAK